MGQALTEHDVKPIGQPKIDDLQFEEGSDFTFKATFEVFPDLDPALIDGDDIEQIKCKIGAADVKEMIATLREQRKGWKESARAASKKGDRVTINFEGFLDGKAFEGGNGQDHALVLGSGSMIPGFEDGIVGMKKGYARDVEVTFPEDYHAENLKGKAAVFKIEVTNWSVENYQLLTKSLLRRLGWNQATKKILRQRSRSKWLRELSMTLKNLNKTKIFDVLLEKNSDTPVPESATKSEIDALKKQAAERFGGDSSLILISYLMNCLRSKPNVVCDLGFSLARLLKSLNLRLMPIA